MNRRLEIGIDIHVSMLIWICDLRRWMWRFFKNTSELTKLVATRLCCFYSLSISVISCCPKHLRFLRLKTSAEVLFFPLYKPSHLQSELCKWIFLDLFDTLNAAVISISPYLLWLRRQCRFSKIPNIFVYLTTTALNYSQNFFRVVYRPLWWAESRCDIHLSIAPLVVALQWKSTAIFEDAEHFWTPHHHRFELQSELLGRWFLDLFDALNPSALPICR